MLLEFYHLACKASQQTNHALADPQKRQNQHNNRARATDTLPFGLQNLAS